MKVRLYDLRTKIVRSRLGTLVQKIDSKINEYVSLPYKLAKRRYLQYKSDKRERKWVELMFLFGKPTTSYGNGMSSGMPIDVLDQLVKTKPSLKALQAQVVSECDKLRASKA